MIKQATQKEAMSLAKLAIQMWEDNKIEELADTLKNWWRMKMQPAF